MQAQAIALAASLVFGPAPADSGAVAAPTTADAEPRETSLPDVDDSPEGEAEPALTEVEAEQPVEPEQAPEPEPEPKPEPPAPNVEQTDAAPPPISVERDRLGCDGSPSCQRMTVVGIVVGTLGLAALGTGVGLLVRKDQVVPDSPTFVHSTRPAGIVTVTLGAGVTLTAVLMLVASHRGYKQARAVKPGRKQARVELMPNGLRF